MNASGVIYSMLSRPAAMLTLTNNLTVTANVIFARREYCPDAHIIKLGTMGEYSTPNIEAEEHYYNPKHTGLLDLGLQPHYLTDEVIREMLERVYKYKDCINPGRISFWRHGF